MLKEIGYLLLATVILSGCQKISDKELEALNSQAEKAEQLQLENRQLKQKQESLMQTVNSLNEQLAQEVADKEILIEQNARTGGIKLTMQEEILFSSNSYKVNQKGASKILKKVVESLDNTGSKTKLRIVGHSDNMPVAKKWRNMFSDNWDLSARRAGEVARFLIWGYNFPKENITVAGKADVEPVASNATKEGRAKNRRIEIFIEK